MHALDDTRQSTAKERLKDPKAWKKSFMDVALWFMACTVLLQVIKQLSPGYPILVTSPSIPQGLYWLDTRVSEFKRGDYLNFKFQPLQPWLSSRYAREDFTFTKQVLGVGGDVISLDDDGSLTICKPSSGEISVERCTSAGSILKVDSQGRPLFAWLEPGTAYTLQPNELWLYGPHPRSLDSRYYGPIYAGSAKGKAYPLFQLND